MTNSRLNSNGGEQLFGGVTYNCKTVIVGFNRKAVEKEMARRGVANKNFALFEFWFNRRRIKSKLISKPAKFKLMARHCDAIENSCGDFLETSGGEF